MFFLFVATITSIVMDIQHVSAGLDNPVNSPPPETLILLLSVVACLILASLWLAVKPNWFSPPLILMILTTALGFLYILGNVLTANYGIPSGSTFAGVLASIEPYLGILAGLAYTVIGGWRIMDNKGKLRIAYIVTLLGGYTLEYFIMSNVLAGSSIVLGTIIIYDFGFLGVTNASVVFLVFAAISAFTTGCYLVASTLSGSGGRRDASFYYGLAGLILIVTGLVFDSEVVTTYILLPLISSTLIVVYAESGLSHDKREDKQVSALNLISKQASDLDPRNE